MTEDEYDAMIEAELRKEAPPKSPQQPREPKQENDEKIPVVCPGCGGLLMVPFRYAGKRVQCKKCDTAFLARSGGAPLPENKAEIPHPRKVETRSAERSIATKLSLSPKAQLAISLAVLLGAPVTVIFLCCGGLGNGGGGGNDPPVRNHDQATPVAIKERNDGSAVGLTQYRERASSDDAASVEEAFFHGSARALVIRHVEPNRLGVGGLEFRVKRNPIGPGCFVYHPQTRFAGAERNLVWLVLDEDRAYALNSPSKIVTPALKWPRDDGVSSPSTSEIVDYVFHHEPISAPVAPPAAEEVRFGYTEERRRAIYTLIVLIEDSSQTDIGLARTDPGDVRAAVESLYPGDYMAQADALARMAENHRTVARELGLRVDTFRAISDEHVSELASKLVKIRKAALAAELELTTGQLEEIADEGLHNNWPLPQNGQ